MTLGVKERVLPFGLLPAEGDVELYEMFVEPGDG
jgi:hypothetical protein